jgi:cell division protein ZapA (FtsZ GTPase activity inhibitor)
MSVILIILSLNFMAEFQTKIQELEFLHSKIESERKMLEAKLNQQKEFQKIYFDVKAQ